MKSLRNFMVIMKSDEKIVHRKIALRRFSPNKFPSWLELGLG